MEPKGYSHRIGGQQETPSDPHFDRPRGQLLLRLRAHEDGFRFDLPGITAGLAATTVEFASRIKVAILAGV